MRDPTALSLILALMIGCSSGKAEDSGGDTASSAAVSSADEGNWWEDGDTGGDWSGDTGKEDSDEESEAFIVFEFTLNRSTGMGAFEGRIGSCEASGLLLNAEELEPCSDCSQSMSMTYDSVLLTGDDCDDLNDLDGAVEMFGHGKDEIFEVDGLGVHALYGLDSEEGEIWEEVLGGYSVMHEGVWYFGLEF